MKLQFSLATLLVCTAAIAVASYLSVRIEVLETMHFISSATNIYEGHWEPIYRKPMAYEITWRMAWSSPLVVAATLGVLWAVRRLNRRHTEPPVG
jgi:hypothetical protein